MEKDLNKDQILTDRQKQVVEYMREYLAQNDNLPPYREICHQFGFKSTNAVAKHLEYIEKKGFIERVKLNYDPTKRSNMFRFKR